ncbi:MAG: hypothetical protein Q8M17_01920 [Actinomycetota bacterium]|nr:hypothetical protein [Actinomycetota bacterium]
MSEGPTVNAPQLPEDADAREEVRQVQDGYEDAGPPTGVVTDELKEASTQDE